MQINNLVQEVLEAKTVGLYESEQFFENRILTVKDGAQFLKVSTRTLYRMVKAGEVPYKKLGRQIRFSSESLLEWVKGG